jgi:hypothetical protein
VDQRLVDHFEKRLDELQSAPPSSELEARAPMPGEEASWGIVCNALRQVREELPAQTGKTLRADGALALNLGFLELVARPLLATGTISGQELNELMIGDMRRVTKQAAAITADEEVSSHAVVSAIDQTWSQLRLAAMPYW